MRIPAPKKNIKISQKEALFLREISNLLREAALDDPQLQEIFVNRIRLSPDLSLCTVYFYAPGGKPQFDTILERLKLYKPSLRKALASRVALRHTPDLLFKFDELFEKHERLEHLFEKIKKE